MTQQSSIAERLEDWTIVVFCGAWSGSGCFIVVIILAFFLYGERGFVTTTPRAAEPAKSAEIQCEPFDNSEFVEK